MVTAISSPDVKRLFDKKLCEQLPIADWLTITEDFTDYKQLRKYPDGNYIIFAKYQNSLPSQLPLMCDDNRLTSVVFYKDHADIQNWMDGLQTFSANPSDKVRILSMQKPFYLKWVDIIYDSLHQHRFSGNLSKHLPEETTNIELAEILSNGASLAIYTGHGRSRGWSGYRGFRWAHVEEFEQRSPIGTMITLTCSNLKQDKDFSVPFGLQYVMEGRCCTFLGTDDAVKIRPLEKITHFFLDSMKDSNTDRIDKLIFKINNRVLNLNDVAVTQNWKTFRLIGNPLQRI